MPRPLPVQPRRAPEVTVEGLQYRVQKWLDDAAVDVADDLSRYGHVEGEDILYLETLDGKKFKIKITTQVEVEADEAGSH